MPLGCETLPTPSELRILIVEDEIFARNALASLLSSHGYLTTVACSAESAIDQLGAGYQAQVALVDLDLPGMSGAEFIGKLSQDRPDVYPILISAAETDRVAMLLDSSVARLRKPLDFAALLTILDQRQQTLV